MEEIGSQESQLLIESTLDVPGSVLKRLDGALGEDNIHRFVIFDVPLLRLRISW